MNKAWIFGLAFLLPLPGFSQRRDTVLAVHHLFKQKRRSGAGWASTGTSMAYDESIGWRAHGTTAEKAASATFYGGIPLAVGVLQSFRYSLERENDVIQQYSQEGPIPADIRRKLRNKHFHRTVRDITAW